jgi:nitroreductase
VAFHGSSISAVRAGIPRTSWETALRGFCRRPLDVAALRRMRRRVDRRASTVARSTCRDLPDRAGLRDVRRLVRGARAELTMTTADAPAAVAASAIDAVALLERTSHAFAFAPGPLPPMALRRIAEAGRLAPSLYNTQPVRFVIVRDREAYEKLRAGCNKSRDTFVKGRKVFATMNKRLNHPLFVKGLERQLTGDVLPEHGYAIVTLHDDALTESVEAASCALMAMQLEATALGLASAFCSWTRGLSFQKEMVAMLGVPKGFKPFTSLIVGNPVKPLAPSPKARRAFDDAVTWI